MRLKGIQILIDIALSQLTFLILIENQIDLLQCSEPKSSYFQNLDKFVNYNSN